MNSIYNNFVEAIGNTPLIRLNGPSKETGCNILGKAEFLNPGGSVKDRAALAIIKEAEENNIIKKGGTIVEGTAGNTGIGLTLIANSKGYKSIIVMPETQTKEKIDTLRSIGADLRLVPAKPYKDPDNYIKFSEKLAKEIYKKNNGNTIWANQFDNTANLNGHYNNTGKEIWNQTKGKIDGFICSSGTGGTIAGVGKALKEKNNKMKQDVFISEAIDNGFRISKKPTQDEVTNPEILTLGFSEEHRKNMIKEMKKEKLGEFVGIMCLSSKGAKNLVRIYERLKKKNLQKGVHCWCLQTT